MVLSVERQRQVHMSFVDIGDNSAFYSRDQEQKGNQRGFRNMRKKGIGDKRNAFCEVCNKSGHSKDTCFKVRGYLTGTRTFSDRGRKVGLQLEVI
ncbi:UNVERIFIED_CONTAM: hypothetical protein Slati_3939700 [Sesamum latifolium]|uniref:Uncharacterized protein n=1 Tax=Sesamum latifolium TaxID=2727402 RepID=A0AAW2TMT6_9LAMI